MKVGIMTFHWATNYGAVLQAFALQTHLNRLGIEASIIDYVPFTYEKKMTNFLSRNPSKIPKKIIDYFKEKKISTFRKKHLILSKRYSSIQELQNNPPPCDAYICGSDQIWNPHFTMHGEGKITLSYFLDFGNQNKKRIAYAASFGCVNYPEDLSDILREKLIRFNAISVREKSGLEILAELSFDKAVLSADPTILLNANEYESLFSSEKNVSDSHSFFYTIHSEQPLVNAVKQYLRKKLSNRIIDTSKVKYSTVGIEKWCQFIHSSNFVFTNSYHGMIFSIIFRKPFIVALVQGKNVGMNDRIFTLLEKVGLTHRIIDNFDSDKLEALLKSRIDWEIVEKRLEIFRKESSEFLKKHLLETAV